MAAQPYFFSDTTSSEVMEMTQRAPGYSYWIIVSLVFCIFLISLARLRQREVFLILFQNTVLFRSNAEQLKEGIRENPFSSAVLILQFICISALSIYWLNSDRLYHWNLVQSLAILLFPFALLIYTSFIASTTSFISNTTRLIPEINHITFSLTQSLGIVVLTEFFIFFFKPEYKILGNLVILSTFGIFYILRLIRGIFIGIQQGVSWYYLILYFWTLEILPVLILAKVLFNQEFSDFLG